MTRYSHRKRNKLRGPAVKIDFNVRLYNLRGTKQLEHLTEDGAKEPASLGLVCITALLKCERQKLKAFKMAETISNAISNEELTAVVDVSPEDLTFLRAEIERLYPPIVVGPCFRLLGGEKTHD